MPDAWKQARVLGGLYQKLAASLAGEAACPRIASFKIAYGWIDTSGDTPVPQEPPFDAADLPGSAIYSGAVTASASDKSTLITAVVPEGAVSAPTEATVIGLYDQADALVAAVTFLPEWITPDKRYEHLIHLTFPTE